MDGGSNLWMEHGSLDNNLATFANIPMEDCPPKKAARPLHRESDPGWALEVFKGYTPFLAQLPTSSLAPTDRQHGDELNSIKSSVPSRLVTQLDESLEGGFTTALAVAFSVLIARHAQSNEVALGIWEPYGTRPLCTPIRLSLLKEDLNEVDDAEGDGSVVTAESRFLSTAKLCSKFQDARSRVLTEKTRLDAAAMAVLNRDLTTGKGQCLDFAIALGRMAMPEQGFFSELCLCCPDWESFSTAFGDPNGKLKLELRFRRRHFDQPTARKMLAQLLRVLSSFQDSTVMTLPVSRVDLWGRSAPHNTASGRTNYTNNNLANRLLQQEPPTSFPTLDVGMDEVFHWGDNYTPSIYHPDSPHFWSADRTITSVIMDAAKKAPGAPAIVDDSDGKSYNYHELMLLAGGIAAELQQLGVGPDMLVPLLAQRGAFMIFGILGILLAGGAYVPLDLHWPQARHLDVLKQLKSPALAISAACHEMGVALSSHCKLTVVELEAAASRGSILKPPTLSGRNLVYAFFTSGSTGQPKGVVVEHQGLVHRMHWTQSMWPLRWGEGVMLKVAYTFGLSEWEVFWPLCAGATLVLAPQGGERDPEYLLQRICGQFPSTPHVHLAAHVFVPSMMEMILDQIEELEAAAKDHNLESFWWRQSPARHLISCGEALKPELAQRVFQHFPNRPGLSNLCGPTEGELTEYLVPRGVVLTRMLGGRPMAGCKVFLSDIRRRQVLAAVLEPGELAFGGPFIARGYLNAPNLTSKAFVDDFTSLEGKLYLTGDLGRWRVKEDGTADIELMGRRDFQVKLRGFRIELGEIEAAARDAGAQTAVCMLSKTEGREFLVLYFEPRQASQVSEAEVRAKCSQRLPVYMQPQSVMKLAKLPRSSNGKIDRPKLPAPVLAEVAEVSNAATASTFEEKVISEVWAEVLGLNAETLPIDALFATLGGTSLMAGRITGLLRRRLDISVPSTTIYRHPTVRRLGEVLAGLKKDAADVRPYTSTVLAPALQPATPALSSTRPFVLLVQGLGAFLISFLFQEYLSPMWWLAGYVYYKCGRVALFCYLPFALLLNMVFQVVMALLLKWLVVGRLRPGKYQLWSWGYLSWWLNAQLSGCILHDILPQFGDCPLANVLLRLLGANIGVGANIDGNIRCREPDLLTVGKGASIAGSTRLSCSAFIRGVLYLGEISVGEGAAVSPGAVISQGTHIPRGRVVAPLSTASGWHGAVGSVALMTAPPRPSEAWCATQGMLRVFLGFPWILLMESVAMVPAVLALDFMWFFISMNPRTSAACVALMVWTYSHVLWLSFLFVTVLQKRLLIGPLTPETAANNESNHFFHLRLWVHGKMVSSKKFSEICKMWNSTEVLVWIYRLLGAKIGWRVQMDQLGLVEHDSLEVGDYALFGARVSVTCNASKPWAGGGRGFERVKIGAGGNVLDTVVLMPGTEISERAILGSSTVAPKRSYFPPRSVHTGVVKGRPLQLESFTSERVTQMEDEAMRRLESPLIWWRYNAIIVLFVLLMQPLSQVIWLVTYVVVLQMVDPSESLHLAIALIPLIFTIESVGVLLFSIALKWTLIGRYTVGDYPFFSSYHVRWMAMLTFQLFGEDFLRFILGTPFFVWYFRANGATVGQNCLIWSRTVEYDLLFLGDNVSIGDGCDVTKHTVENMVLKFAPVRLRSGASILSGTCAMPGSTLEENVVLLEHTQVLKGDVVPAGEVWAGIPGAKCEPVAAGLRPMECENYGSYGTFP